MIKNGKIAKINNVKVPPLSSIEIGEICGANIKPIKVKKEKKIKIGCAKYVRDVTIWGVFIHVRMESGDQYDLVFRIGRTALLNQWSLPAHWGVDKDKYPEWNIPWILTIFGANEWVELIGKRVRIDVQYTEGDNHVLSVSGRNDKVKSLPDYYEIIKHKFEPSLFPTFTNSREDKQ